MAGDISTVMSPRTVITWAENAEIFGDLGFAFRVTFLNKCDEAERHIVAEYYQRCFGIELPEIGGQPRLRLGRLGRGREAESRRAPAGAGLRRCGRWRTTAGVDVAFRGRERRRPRPRLRPSRPPGACRAPDLTPDEIGRVRGEADMAALRIRLHDQGLHRRFAPQGEVAALLYDRLEQIRVEAVGGETWPASGPISPTLSRPGRPASGGRARPGRDHGRDRRSVIPRAAAPAIELSPAQTEAADRLERVAGPRVATELAALGRLPARPGSLRPPGPRDAGASRPRRGAGRAARGRRPGGAGRGRGSAAGRRRGRRRGRGRGGGSAGEQRPGRARRRRRGRERGRGQASDSADESEGRPGAEDDVEEEPRHQSAAVPAARRRLAGLPRVRDQLRRGGHGRGAVRPLRADPPARPARPVAGALPGHDRPHGQPAAAPADGAADSAPGRSTSTRACSTPPGCRGSSSTRRPRSRSRWRTRPSSATRSSRC